VLSRVFVVCECTFEHELRMPERPASAAAAAAAASAPPSHPTNAELVRLIPVNALMMESIGQRRQLERMLREQQQQLQGRGGVARCIYPDCDQSALFWCEQCQGDLCAAHDRDLHPAAAAAASSSSAHRRIPLSERAAAQQAEMASRLAVSGAQQRAALLHARQSCIASVSALSAKLDAEVARHEHQVLAPIRTQLAADRDRLAVLEAIDADVSRLSDTQLLKHSARISQAVGPAVPLDGLLAALSSERRADLQRFLHMADVSLVRSSCAAAARVR